MREGTEADPSTPPGPSASSRCAAGTRRRWCSTWTRPWCTAASSQYPIRITSSQWRSTARRVARTRHPHPGKGGPWTLVSALHQRPSTHTRSVARLQILDVYVLKRPHLDEFMNRVCPKFEVIVFTASLAKYADPLLDLLDRPRQVRWRLFREACFPYEGETSAGPACLPSLPACPPCLPACLPACLPSLPACLPACLPPPNPRRVVQARM